MSRHELPEYYPVEDILQRIKRGDNQRLIQQIRQSKVKEQRDKLKRQLLWILFSGKFSVRSNDGMIQHSGLICLDFDNMSTEDMAIWKTKLQKNPHTYALFTSPSGNGLKCLWKIPICQSNDEHNRRFDAIAADFAKCEFFDLNVKGWARVCFDSVDPKIYVNPEAVIYEGIAAPPEVQVRTGGDEVTEYDIVFDRLVKWFEGKYNLNVGNRNQGAFVFASAVADYIPEAIAHGMIENYIMSHVEQADGQRYTIAELHQSIKSAYRNTPTPRKTMMENTQREAVNYDDSLEDVEEELPTQEKRIIFWLVKGKNSLEIDFFALKYFLQSKHYYRMDFSDKDFAFVKIENNTVEQITIRDLKGFVLNTLNRWGEKEVFNLIAGHPKFRKDYLDLLDPIDLHFLRDTKEESYVFYQNCAVKVTKDGISKLSYDQLDGFIWASQKLKRSFDFDTNVCDASKFVFNVCNGSESRILAYVGAMGYLMHTYKDRSLVPAVVYTDEIMASEPSGGSGKGLTIKMVGQIRKVEIYDGKNFATNKNFAWQRVGLDTQIIALEDPPKNMELEKFFSIITEGIAIEKKNQQEIFLDFARSPKLAITTNTVLKGNSTSHNRRKFELELHPRYTENFQPVDEFKRVFFDEWDAAEWKRFDNFMMKCIQSFLERGLVAPEYVNLKYKKLERTTHEFFPEWAKSNLQLGRTYKRTASLDAFRDDTGIKDHYPRPLDFLRWMRAWAEFNGWDAVPCGAGKMSVQFLGAGEVQVVDDNLMPF